MVVEHYNDTYEQYCKFLQEKYGIPTGPYLVRNKKGNLTKNQKITRGREGLYIHHIKETDLDMLCNIEHTLANEAATNDKSINEWQRPENLCYCNLLEHFLLHLLIEKDGYRPYGSSGGIFIFIGPELNDIYSGYQTASSSKQSEWRARAREVIIDYKDEYLTILSEFIKDSNLPSERFTSSLNESFGTWKNAKNVALYNELEKLVTTKDTNI